MINLTNETMVFLLQYGLYSAFMGCFMYMIFGTSKDMALGPAAMIALLTGHYAAKGPAFAVLLAFLSGLIIISVGLLQLGKKCSIKSTIAYPNLTFQDL